LEFTEFLTKPRREFKDVVDVFNPDHLLSGYMCTESGKYYGSLWLTHINGMQCEAQFIMSAPKMYYPHNRFGKFFFHHTLEVSPAYQKYDGTAIICYVYRFRRKEYVTYKTRMTPVMHSFESYDFVKMWREMLERYPAIKRLPSMERTAVCELYGIRNKHLIIYPTPLDTALIFGIDRKSEQILLPESFTTEVPTATVYYQIKPENNFEDFYKRIRGELENTNKTTDFGIEGSEGSVVYVKDPELGWVQWKCKPESVMAVHAKPGLNKQDILTTCYNALENVSVEELTYTFVKELLLEEITDREVEARQDLVWKCINDVKFEVKLRNEVLQKYKEFGVKLMEDKRQVMRYMSQFCPKDKMRYVYSIISAMEGKVNV